MQEQSEEGQMTTTAAATARWAADEMSPAELAELLRAATPDTAQTTAVNASGGRFASYAIRLANGQVFHVQIEEE
jgi:hypothetical protein